MDLVGAEPAAGLKTRGGEGYLDGVVLALLAQGEGAAGDDHGGPKKSGFHEHAWATGEYVIIPHDPRLVKVPQADRIVMKSPHPP